LAEYPNFHSGSLLLSWAEVQIASKKESGPFHCPLAADFQAILKMSPDSSQSSSGIGISSEKEITILRRNLSQSSTSAVAGVMRELNLGNDREGVFLFHGTCLQNAQDIIHDGVSNQFSKPWCDFGPGYYLTPDWAEAVLHATKLRSSPDSDDPGFSPCVVCYLWSRFGRFSPRSQLLVLALWESQSLTPKIGFVVSAKGERIDLYPLSGTVEF